VDQRQHREAVYHGSSRACDSPVLALPQRSWGFQVHNASQSSRALGWDTNNYLSNEYRGCGNLSSTTFTHTGTRAPFRGVKGGR
jgi:hypothetical protein